MSNDGFYTFLGIVGACVFLLTYLLVSTNKITSESMEFHLLNVAGALVLGVYGALLHAWPIVALDAFWASVGILHITRIVKKT